MHDLISKKDLLKETGISYGQLYRWKRQNLIPEAWFIKQSSFTGQETFFPRQRILDRINAILELKDQYSLDDLARLFYPDMTERNFTIQEIQQIFGSISHLYKSYQKISQNNAFTFVEILLLEALIGISAEYRFDESTMRHFAKCMYDWTALIQPNINYRMIILLNNDSYLLYLIEQDAHILFDTASTVIKDIDLEHLAKDIHMKIKSCLGE